MWKLSKHGRIEQMYVFRSGPDGYAPIGLLAFEGGALNRVGRFLYGSSFLGSEGRRPIDPAGLPLTTKWKPAAPEEVHLAFHDVGPDGWGKGILTQAFPQRELGMPEFLALGGLSRTGDLAFGPTPDAPATWTPEEEPALVLPADEDSLEDLLAAAESVDAGEAPRHHLARLVRNSSDVGGARPKARLRSGGREWIAKFSTWGDKFDDPKAEAVCLDVAEAAGLAVPERELRVIAGKSVLLVSRFDRSADGARYSYLSAGTLLNEPVQTYGTRFTYVDIAEAARRIGVPSPEKEMFRRLLVNAHLKNTDDHLRNHAVIHDGTGWSLSPVFDVVPHPGRGRHVCAPAPGVGPEWNPDATFAAHPKFGLAAGEAAAILDQVREAVARIPEFMEAREMPAKDRELLLPCFGLAAEVGADPKPKGFG
ncbi:hypothetical protein LPLAFNJD_LOCUS1955 [Methylorubrum aminovorans]